MSAEGTVLNMRAIWLLVCTCAVALLAAACGTSLGPQGEGLELQPGPPLAVEQPPEPPQPVDPLLEEEIDPELEPELLPEEPVEPVEEVVAVNPFSEAVRLLLRGRSVRMAVTATGVVPETQAEFKVRTDGFFDVRTFVGAIDVDGTNLVKKLGENGELAASLVPGRIVFGENRVFLNYEQLPAVAFGQLPWASARYRQLVGTPVWPDQGAVAALALTTPAHIAAMLTASRETLVEIGRQPIRGASSTHYQAVVDLGKLAAAAPEATRGAIRGQARALAAELGTTELPIDVWLDAKGRLRRVQIDLSGAVAAAPEPDTAEAAESAAREPAPDAEGAEGDEGAAPNEPVSEEPASSDAQADEEGSRSLEGAKQAPEPQRASAVLVIDFVTFGGRVRAQPPAEDETGPYGPIVRLARATGASLVGG